MTQIMKPSLRKTSLLKEAMELMSHYSSVQRKAIWTRKDEPPVLPVLAACIAFGGLSSSMFNQSLGDARWHDDCSSAPRRLGLD